MSDLTSSVAARRAAARSWLQRAWFLISPVRYIASPFWISLAWVADCVPERSDTDGIVRSKPAVWSRA
jgi:hypothetical protein